MNGRPCPIPPASDSSVRITLWFETGEENISGREGAGGGPDMPSRRRTKSAPIGIDLGTRCIKIFQLRHEPDGSLSAVAQIKKTPSQSGSGGQGNLDELAALIQQLLGSDQFSGRSVVTSLPDRVLEYRNMRFAPISDSDLESAVRWQIGHQLNKSTDDLKTQLFQAAGQTSR